MTEKEKEEYYKIQLDFAIEELNKMQSNKRCILNIKNRFFYNEEETGFIKARQLYKKAENELKKYKHRIKNLEFTKDDFIQEMLDLKDRCKDAKDLRCELYVMQDLSKLFGFSNGIKQDNIDVDKDTEIKQEQRLAELINKYQSNYKIKTRG